MGRHHQQSAGHGVRPAHLALGAGALAAMIGGSGVAVALGSAPAQAAPAPVASVAPVVVATEPAPAAIRTTKATTTAITTATARTTGTARTTPKAPICDLSGPPEFGDPANPDVITNRRCGYVDAQGRERSRDRWIDDQLLDAAR